jgi:hypothetical protein
MGAPADPKKDPLAGREIYLELIELGELLRVNAVDAATGLEAFAAGPRTASRHEIERIALGKLARRLAGKGAIAAPAEPGQAGSQTQERGRRV